MTNPIPVELKHAYRLLNHGPTVLVSSAYRGKRNIMAAAWCMALDFSPPKVSVVIDKSTYTRTLVESSGVLALNIPIVEMASQVMQVGSASGRDGDKFLLQGMSVFPASQIDVPLLAGCAAWLECKVLPETEIEAKYDLFIAEVVAAWADPDLFQNGRWIPPSDPSRRTLHYIAGGQFFTTGELIQADSPANAND